MLYGWLAMDISLSKWYIQLESQVMLVNLKPPGTECIVLNARIYHGISLSRIWTYICYWKDLQPNNESESCETEKWDWEWRCGTHILERLLVKPDAAMNSSSMSAKIAWRSWSFPVSLLLRAWLPDPPWFLKQKGVGCWTYHIKQLLCAPAPYYPPKKGSSSSLFSEVCSILHLFAEVNYFGQFIRANCNHLQVKNF